MFYFTTLWRLKWLQKRKLLNQQRKKASRMAREEKLIELRPKFKLKESDYKRMMKTASLIGVSMSQYIKMAVETHVGNAK